MLDLILVHPARTIREVVSRETADVCYGVTARKGQHLDVRITHIDSNPVGLAVFRPGYTFTRIADGEVVDGSHLPGLGNTDVGTSAKTVIDQDGTWLLDFGLANGGAAAFTFRASLK